MAQPHPNAQLEAALVQFGQQAVVSPDQEAQLRAAITADAQLLGQLNQSAQAGQLQGFSLPAAGSAAPNHVGYYDLQTGVVTLPTAAFQPSGTTASADLKAMLQVQEMTIRFGHGTYPVPTPPGASTPPTPQPVSQDMLDNLQATLNGSPVLAEQVKKAAMTRDISPNSTGMLLENFGFVAPNISAGGTYDGSTHTMNLPALGLQTKTTANPQGNFNADDLTFVIGHEIQHGFNHPAKAQATGTLHQQVRQIAGTAAVVHDYSEPTRAYIQAGREDEAKAEIAGWNALLSRKQQGNPSFSLDDMRQWTSASSRTADFIELDITTNTTVPRAGLSFNPDNTLSQAPANVAAMGQHYFNRPDAGAPPNQRPLHLGESRKTDYANYYGTYAVETIIAAERQHAQHHPAVVHKLTLDMAGIGLKENLMEQEGINITINKATPQPFYDSSQTPAAQGNFHHTQDGSVSPQHNHQHVPVAPAAPAMARDFSSSAGADPSEQQRVADTNRTPGHAIDPSTANQSKADLFQHTAATHQHVNPIFADPFQEQERREQEAKEKEDRYRENGTHDEERFRKADEARDPRNVGKPGMRDNDGAQAEPSISLGSPHRDRAYAALKAGDSDEVGRIAVEFAQSPRGQELIERGNQLLAQQQAQELQQLLEQNRQLEQQRESERQRSGPVMTLMQPSPHHHH